MDQSDRSNLNFWNTMKQSKQNQVSTQFQSESIPISISKQTNEEQISSYLLWLQIRSKQDLARMNQHQLSRLGGFVYHDLRNPFIQNLAVKIIRHTKDFEFVDVQVRIGHLVFPKISILNINIKSPLHDQTEIAKGMFGTIYQCECLGKKLAVKCFKNLFQQFASEKTFKMALYEYCILLLASHFKAGPKMENIFGYQIVVYSTCIEITMELCQKDYNKSDLQIPRLQNDLKDSLFSLHTLNIIHFDIKVDNFVFSPEFNKYVLIDFGLSKVIKQNLGQKTLTIFKGTYANSSPEMKELYRSKEQSFVDLYYNDMYSLKKTIELQQNKLGQQFSQQVMRAQQTIINVQKFHKLFMLKYSLFQLNMQEQTSLKILKQNSYVIQKIFAFMNNLTNSLEIQQFVFRLREKCRHIKITDSNQNNLNNQFQDSNSTNGEEKQNLLLKTLNKINIDQKADYYISHLNQNNKQGIKSIGTLLKSYVKIAKLKNIDYMLILSKAIELNSAKFNVQDIVSFCIVALEVLKVDIKEIDKRFIPIKQLVAVIMFLLEQSLHQQLKEQYLDVFIYSLSNAVILKLYSFQQFYTFYERIVDFPLNFSKRMRVLLNFNSMMKWLEIQCDQQAYIKANYEKFKRKNIEIIQAYMKDNASDTQLSIIKPILDFNIIIEPTDIVDNRILRQIDYDNELLIDIKIWMCFQRFFKCYRINDNVMIKITHLLAQKQFYSSYDFLYVHYGFIMRGLEALIQFKKISHFLEKYDKIQIIKKSKLTNLIKAIKILDNKQYSHQAIAQFSKTIHKKLETNINQCICFNLLSVPKQILQQCKLENVPQNQKIISQIVSLNRVLISKYKKYYKLNLATSLIQIISFDRYISARYPNFFSKQKFARQIKQYTKDYLQVKPILTESPQKIIFFAKIKIMMCLFCVLVSMKLKKQAFSLLHKLFLLVKITKFAVTTTFFLSYCFDYIQQESLSLKKFKEYYYLYIEIVNRHGFQQFYFQNLNRTALIIELLLQNDLKKSIKFIENLTNYFRMFKSRQNFFCFITLAQNVSQRCRESKPFIQRYSLLCQNLNVRQNPYHILWHYYNTYYHRDMSHRNFMKLFYQSVDSLHSDVKQVIFKNVFLNCLKEDWEFLDKRKITNLCILLIRSQSIKMGKVHIIKICKKLYEWNPQTESEKFVYAQINQKIQKYQTSIQITEQSKRQFQIYTRYYVQHLIDIVQLTLRRERQFTLME